MNKIQNCLVRPPSRGKCHKMSFLRTQQNGASSFEPSHFDHNHGALNYSAILPTKLLINPQLKSIYKSIARIRIVNI